MKSFEAHSQEIEGERLSVPPEFNESFVDAESSELIGRSITELSTLEDKQSVLERFYQDESGEINFSGFGAAFGGLVRALTADGRAERREQKADRLENSLNAHMHGPAVEKARLGDKSARVHPDRELRPVTLSQRRQRVRAEDRMQKNSQRGTLAGTIQKSYQRPGVEFGSDEHIAIVKNDRLRSSERRAELKAIKEYRVLRHRMGETLDKVAASADGRDIPSRVLRNRLDRLDRPQTEPQPAPNEQHLPEVTDIAALIEAARKGSWSTDPEIYAIQRRHVRTADDDRRERELERRQESMSRRGQVSRHDTRAGNPSISIGDARLRSATHTDPVDTDFNKDKPAEPERQSANYERWLAEESIGALYAKIGDEIRSQVRKEKARKGSDSGEQLPTEEFEQIRDRARQEILSEYFVDEYGRPVPAEVQDLVITALRKLGRKSPSTPKSSPKRIHRPPSNDAYQNLLNSVPNA
jgi:hypothetical protein